MTSKKWGICFVAILLTLLSSAAMLTAVIDPYFHYHKPFASLCYPMDSERYQNYGILEHFSYDTIITGSSMTQNFRASECDALFNAVTVKTPLAGGTFKEFHDMLAHAIDANPNLRRIFFGLDGWLFFENKDAMREGEVFPEFLYDDQLFNDTQYVLNKSILLEDTLSVLEQTADEQEGRKEGRKEGSGSADFDAYSFWAHQAIFDREYVISHYSRPEKQELNPTMAYYFMENVSETLAQNILPLVEENPDIEFYFFFTPYSILSIDEQMQTNMLELYCDAYILISQQLLQYDNVNLFSFFNDYETITNLDNYFDTIHYSDSINSLLLKRMSLGEYQLTKENHLAHWQEVRSWYLAYDYEALFLS